LELSEYSERLLSLDVPGSVDNISPDNSRSVDDTSHQESVDNSEENRQSSQSSNTRLRIPFSCIRFCPICGQPGLGSEAVKHIRKCLLKEPSSDQSHQKHIAAPSRERRELSCPSCGKVYVSLKHLEKHRFFCDTAVNLADYEGKTQKRNAAGTQQAVKHEENVVVSEQQLMGDNMNLLVQEDLNDSLGIDLDPSQYTPVHSVCFSNFEESELRNLGGQVYEPPAPGAEVPEESNQPAKPANPHQCPICLKVFRVASYLRKHLQTTHNQAKNEICRFCSASFKDRTSLKNHIKGHTDERPFPCTRCNKSFRRKESLVYHENSHDNKRSIICSHCGKNFRNLRDMRSHEALKHSSQQFKKFDCKLCQFDFGSKSALDEHKILHHGKKVFFCRECQKKFATNSNLEEHLRSHTGSKPFQCSFCPKAFKRKAHKELHEKRHNLTGKYSCPQCNKRFPQQSELVKHMSVHMVKYFKCTVCKQSYSSKSQLKEHMECHDPLGGLDGDLMHQQQTIQTISVKTEKFKTIDDTITTKTVYVMEPDVPGGSSSGSGNILCSPYTLGIPQFRSDKEVGATIVIPANKEHQDGAHPLTEIRLHQYM